MIGCKTFNDRGLATSGICITVTCFQSFPVFKDVLMFSIKACCYNIIRRKRVG